MILITTTTATLWAALAYAWVRWTTWIINPGEGRDRIISEAPANQTGYLQAENKTITLWNQTGSNETWTEERIPEMAKEVAGKVREGAEDALDWTRDKAGQAANWTRDAAHNLTDWTERRMRQGKDTAVHIWDRLRHRFVPSDHHNIRFHDYLSQFMIPSMEMMAPSSSSPSNMDGFQMRTLPHEYVLFFDVAGIPQTSLHVQVARGQLLIHGQHEECVGRACWERAVEEIFELPDDARGEGIESYLHLQVLIVKIPRKSMDPDREVKISQRSSLDMLLQRVGLQE